MYSRSLSRNVSTEGPRSSLLSPLLGQLAALCGGLLLFAFAAAAAYTQSKKVQTLPGAAGNFGSYTNGITSAWILSPLAIATRTPRHKLDALSSGIRWGRWIVMAALLCSFTISVCAWYHWNGILGYVDLLGAIVVVWSSFILGVFRGGEAARCSIFFFYLLNVVGIAEQALERYQPFPHECFRTAGDLVIQSSINMGLSVASRCQLGIIILTSWVFGWSHIALEWWLAGGCAEDACESLFSPGPYALGLLRNLCVVLAWALFTFRWIGEEESDPSSSDLDTEADESDSSGHCKA